ncbi:hypothetical protein RB595_005005 [Gaeumannomyces hyphopodioides]
MQLLVLLLVAVEVSALPLPTSWLASRAEAPAADAIKKTDKYALDLSLKEFNKVAEKKEAGLDWSTDGCSKVPQNPLGFPFRKACERHDFGYRNFANQDRMNSGTRKQIDQRFRKDLKDTCSEQEKGTRTVCKVVAETYYAGVRVFGGSHAKKKSKNKEAAKEGSKEEAANVEARDVDPEAYAEYLRKKAISDAVVADVLARREAGLPDTMEDGDEVEIRW